MVGGVVEDVLDDVNVVGKGSFGYISSLVRVDDVVKGFFDSVVCEVGSNFVVSVEEGDGPDVTELRDVFDPFRDGYGDPIVQYV